MRNAVSTNTLPRRKYSNDRAEAARTWAHLINLASAEGTSLPRRRIRFQARPRLVKRLSSENDKATNHLQQES
jgi:hypothetical protein